MGTDSCVQVDNFKLIKELGEGMSGRVFSARNQLTGEAVAVKLLEQTGDAEYDAKIKTFQNEQKFLSQLSHPNITKFYGFYPNGKLAERSQTRLVSYIVTELAHRGEIFDVLYHYGAFDCNTTRYYIHQLINALNFIHKQGKAHRDVKPENILLDKNLVLKLADFGFATEVAVGKLTRTNLGTPNYMSPELVANEAYDSQKNDVWATGIVLFIFRFGRLPFNIGNGGDHYFRLFVTDREQFWAEQAKLPPKYVPSADFCHLLHTMLEPDFRKRATLDEVLASKWMNEPCDEKRALYDMDSYYQKTRQIMTLRQAHESPIELPENCRSGAAGSWFEEVEIPSIPDSDDRCLTFASQNPYIVLDDLRRFLCDGTTVFKKENGLIIIAVNNSHSDFSARLLIASLGENKYSICLAKRGGSNADLHSLKRKIQGFFWK